MIDLRTEQVIPLHRAPDHLPPGRGGKKLHVSTIYRWASNGLETLMVGGTRCTSLEAIQRYCEQLTKARTGQAGFRTARERSRASVRADSELSKAGI